MKKLLVDTDVTLDFLLDRKPFSDSAHLLFQGIELGAFKAYTTPVMLSNLYFILRQLASHEMVISKLKALVQLLDILPIDKQCSVAALHSDFRDFEDALQYETARKSNEIEIIVTRNSKDYRKSKISVMSPELLIKTFS